MSIASIAELKKKYSGIDISCWNDDTIDWQAVKAAGINFVIIRAGFGNSITQIDSHFKMYIEGALAAGLHVGVYWMSYAISPADAVKEAQVFKQVITPYSGRIDFPTGFDWEYDSDNYFARQTGRKATANEISDMCVAFCAEMKRGCWWAINYQNIDYTRNKLIASKVANIDKWLADYSGGPDIICGMQQTASDGHVNGIDGHVDLDTSYTDYPAVIRAAGLNGYVRSSSVSVPNSHVNGMGEYGPNPILKFSGKYRKTLTYLQEHVGAPQTGIADQKTYDACRKYTIYLNDSGLITLWLQQYLNNLGFNCGVADGVAGHETLAGFARFQRAHGLGTGYLGGTDWYYILEL
jgi:GH25 family lysozyme M1 (1,4-beta-N-acetylmuramidase)